LEPCQFYYIYQGVGTQHGGRAPLMWKLIIKTNANKFCLRRSWMGCAAQACTSLRRSALHYHFARYAPWESGMHCETVSHPVMRMLHYPT